MGHRRDPEVERLTHSIRELTGRARELSREIDTTVIELKAFRDDVATLRENRPDRHDSFLGGHFEQERHRR